MRRMKCKLISALLTLILVFTLVPALAYADGPTDEILDYEITADVNEEDATVDLTYHIEWKVLESDSLGPLEWVSIGIPNDKVQDYTVLSKNIDYIDIDGNFANVYFKKKYYKDEVVSFDFKLKQDYMYSMNALTDGETVFYFTPGWFDEIDVDRLVIRWNNEKALSWDGPVECLIKGGYNTWTTSMPAGDTVSVKISYPNSAFGFDESKSYSDVDPYEDDDIGFFGLILGLLLMLLGAALIIGIPVLIVGAAGALVFGTLSGFASLLGKAGSKPAKSKITRTKVVYYPNCPGCGAPREEGKDTCEYCGHSMIKEEEILKEEEIKEEDRPALKFSKNGTFHYSDEPDTYVRVHVVVPPPPPRHSSSHGGGHKSHGGGSGHHSSCVSSSCACACVSCACACACACAGGGRAGCTTKDFYETNLKLRQLELKKKNKK